MFSRIDLLILDKIVSMAGKSKAGTKKGQDNKPLKGTKRTNSDAKGSDSEREDGNDRSRLRLDVEESQQHCNETTQDISKPQNESDVGGQTYYRGKLGVMQCIGILPSLPIVNHFMTDSDDSDSSTLDLNILPAVSRQSHETTHNSR